MSHGLRITGLNNVALADVSGMCLESGSALVMILDDGLPLHLASLSAGDCIPKVEGSSSAYLVGAPEAVIDPEERREAPVLDALEALAAATHRQRTRQTLIATERESTAASRVVAASAMAAAVEAGDPTQWSPQDPSMRACARVCDWMGVSPTSPLPTSAAEVSIPALRGILGKRGVRTRIVQTDSGWLAGGVLPAVGLTANEKGEQVAVALAPTHLGMRAHSVEEGVSRSAGAVVISGTVLEVLPAVKLGKRGRWLSPHFRITGWPLLALILWCLIGAATSLLVPLANSIVFSAIVPDNDSRRLLWLGAALLVALGLGAFAAIRVGLILARVRVRGEYTAQLALWQKFLAMPVSSVLGIARGDLAARLLSPTATRAALPTPLAISTIVGSFTLVSLVLLFRGGLLLGVAGVLLVVAECTLFVRAARKQRVLVNEALAQARVQSSLAFDMLNSISIIRSSGAEERLGAHWAPAFARQTQARYRLSLVSATTSTVVSVFPTLAATVVVAFVALQGAYGVSAASYLMFSAALAQAIGAVAIVASVITPGLTVSETFRQARFIVAAPTETSGSGDLAPTLRGGVAISNLTFRYGPESPPVLHDVSLEIKPGEFVAVVGPSGAGKSSLMRLLLGFDAPEAGSILYDGVDLRAIDPEHLRSQLGVVMQSSRLIRGTIAENIRVGRPLTDEQLWHAAEMAGVAEVLKEMPMQMNTPIANDGAFSGGQRQRLVIARALAGNPAILIMDEATSALDNATQAHVTNCIDRIGATRIVIAHRLSTVSRADRIVVMDRGRIVETGPPAELMHAGGLFANMAARQVA